VGLIRLCGASHRRIKPIPSLSHLGGWIYLADRYECTYTVTDLTNGMWYFSVSSVDVNQQESTLPPEVSKAVDCPCGQTIPSPRGPSRRSRRRPPRSRPREPSTTCQTESSSDLAVASLHAVTEDATGSRWTSSVCLQYWQTTCGSPGSIHKAAPQLSHFATTSCIGRA